MDIRQLLVDLLGFAGEGVQKFAKGAEASTQRNANIINQISRGEKPNMQGVAGEMSNLVNPMAGVIAPTGNKLLQQLLEVLEQKAPKLVSQAKGLAETVYPYIVPRELMPVQSALGAYRASQTLPKGELYLRGGRPQGEQLDTLAHELRHFLTGFDPVTKSRPAGHLAETAQQIQRMLPEEQAAGVAQYTKPFDWRWKVGGSTGAQGDLSSLVREAEGRSLNVPASLDKAARIAHDESLSYLTESLLARQRGQQGGDPMLEAIAAALGQGLR